MQEEKSIVSNDVSNATKKKSSKIKKRNFQSEDGNEESIKRKKTAEKESGFFLKDGNFIQYKNTKDYVKVIAKPSQLPSAPLFLQQKHVQNGCGNLNPFILDFISFKCFNTDVNTRFSHIKSFFGDSEKNISKGENQSDFTNDELLQSNSSSNLSSDNQKRKKNKHSNSESRDSCVSPEKSVTKSHVELYKVCQSKALVFHLQNPCSFSFHGEIKVTLISGQVEINGYTLSHSSGNKTADLYSPYYCTALVIESKLHDQNKSLQEIKESLSNLLTEEDANKLLSELKPNDSILLVEQILSTLGKILNKYLDVELFPKDLENVSTASKSVKNLQSVFSFTLTEKSRILRKNPNWDRIPLGRCSILCGGKGVGKSTLLRYYINKLVGNNEKVLYLDFDPGQPEFAVPGCLSAVVVDKPLLGPNFTHRFKPEIMVSLGYVDVSQISARYLEAVKHIIEFCNAREDLSKMKCFANTMGYNKGIGIQLMITILKLLKPDTVIQLKSTDRKRNYPFYLSSSNVNHMKGFNMTDNPQLFYSFHIVNAHTEEKSLIQRGLQPIQLREIKMMSYFSQLVSSPFYNFNAVQPYLISFSNLYLAIDSLIVPEDVLKAFNGSMVSLTCFVSGCDEIISPEDDNSDYFRIVVKPNICPCLGLGLVRGIDVSEKKFYLITPLSPEEISKVNCFTLGKISPPHCLFTKQETVEGPKVYTSTDTEEVNQKIKRMFRNPNKFVKAQ